MNYNSPPPQTFFKSLVSEIDDLQYIFELNACMGSIISLRVVNLKKKIRWFSPRCCPKHCETRCAHNTKNASEFSPLNTLIDRFTLA